MIRELGSGFGGAELQTSLIAELLAEKLGACDVITTRSSDGALSPDMRVRCIGVPHRLRISQLRNFLGGFRYFVAQGGRYSVVHGCCLSAFVLGSILGAKLRGCRTVLRVCTVGSEGDVAKLIARPLGVLAWRLFRTADRFIAFTASMEQELCRDGVAADAITIVPNAVSMPAAAPAGPAARATARSALGLPDRPTVLFAARWVAQKRVELLLQAWDLLGTPPATLLLVGDGPQRDLIDRWMHRSAAASSVRVLGWHHDMEAVYAASDIFVFTAREEAFGNAIAEALAHGLAVVSSREGLAREWITDGKDGIIIRDEASMLAQVLKDLIADAPRRQQLGLAARRLAAEQFAPAKIVDRLLGVYTASMRRRQAGVGRPVSED